MKTTVTKSMFIDTVRAYGRLDNFGYDGWCAIFDYIEDYERDTGEEQGMDIVALCCDLTRYESISEFNKEMSEECETMQDVSDLTTLILINGDYEDTEESFIVVNY